MKYCHHICIQTDCYGASLAFYRDLLGFELVKETVDFHGRDYNTWLKLGSFMIELQTAKAERPFSPYSKDSMGIVHFCLCVDDLEEAYRQIKTSGYDGFLPKKGRDVYSVEGGKLFKMAAPEGTIVEFRDSQEI